MSPVVGSCKQSKQFLDSIRGREFLGSLDDSPLPRKDVCTV